MPANMPYKIDWESKNTVWIRFFGNISFSETNQATNDFYNDHRSDYVTGAYWDFTGVTDCDVVKEQVSEIAFTDDAASKYMKPMNAAFITTDPLLATLTKHYIKVMEEQGSHWTNRLFSSMDDARSWIESSLMHD